VAGREHSPSASPRSTPTPPTASCEE
jgi:hypothetical protein